MLDIHLSCMPKYNVGITYAWLVGVAYYQLTPDTIQVRQISARTKIIHIQGLNDSMNCITLELMKVHRLRLREDKYPQTGIWACLPVAYTPVLFRQYSFCGRALLLLQTTTSDFGAWDLNWWKGVLLANMSRGFASDLMSSQWDCTEQFVPVSRYSGVPNSSFEMLPPGIREIETAWN